MRSEVPAELISELRRLGNRELRLTLRQLSADERTRVLTMIEGSSPRPEPSFELLVGLSPWLLKAIEEARGGGPEEGRRQTPATSAALLSALDQLTAANENRREGPKVGSGTFVGRLLARRRARIA
jgi:hypothetical protein